MASYTITWPSPYEWDGTMRLFWRKTSESASDSVDIETTGWDTESYSYTVDVDYDVEYTWSVWALRNPYTLAFQVSSGTFFVESPYEPPIDFNVEYTSTMNSITATVTGVSDNSTVQFKINNQTVSRIGSGSMTIARLEPGTEYVCSIYVDDVFMEALVVSTSGDPVVREDPYVSNIVTTSEQIAIVVDNTRATDTLYVAVNDFEYHTDALDDVTPIILRGSAILPDTNYYVMVQIYRNEDGVMRLVMDWNGYIKTDKYVTDEFNWDTDIRQGVRMNMYSSKPAPVTAVEWNRLVRATNEKLGTVIPMVARGERMIAGIGGNVRDVADALGVSVHSGQQVTAYFFHALRNAVNALM